LKHTEAIIVERNTNSSCSNFVTKNIKLFPQNMEAPTVVCFNATAALNPKLEFDCSNSVELRIDLYGKIDILKVDNL
jgi:hypothetical protein